MKNINAQQIVTSSFSPPPTFPFSVFFLPFFQNYFGAFCTRKNFVISND